MNETFIAASFFSQFYKLTNVNLLHAKQTKIGKDDAFIQWKTDTNGKTYENFIMRSDMEEDKYQLIYAPYEALPYLVAKDRFFENTEDRYCLVSMKERFPTRLYGLQLYNFFLNTKFKPTFDLFTEFFDTADHNIFLDPVFDPIYKDAQDNHLDLLSSHITQFFPKKEEEETSEEIDESSIHEG